MGAHVAARRQPHQSHAAATALVAGLFVIALATAGFLLWTVNQGPPALAAADPLAPEGVHALGDEDAPVTIVRFTDFQCADCAAFQRDVQPVLETEFVDTGTARLVLRHFPVLGQESARAAEAAECAAEQGKFWRYATVLHGWQGRPNSGYFSDELLLQLAQGVRMSKSEVQTCLNSGRHQETVAKDLTDGISLGLGGPMALFINGRPVADPLDLEQIKLHVIGAAAGS